MYLPYCKGLLFCRNLFCRKKGAAKEIIINAAWELFQDKGYEETTLKDIIARSGTSRGALYHNFRSKEDVLFMMAWYFDKEYDGCWRNRIRKRIVPISKSSIHFCEKHSKGANSRKAKSLTIRRESSLKFIVALHTVGCCRNAGIRSRISCRLS